MGHDLRAGYDADRGPARPAAAPCAHRADCRGKLSAEAPATGRDDEGERCCRNWLNTDGVQRRRCISFKSLARKNLYQFSIAVDKRDNIYDDLASGGRDDRPGLTACLKSLRDGDVLVVWKLDRLGRSLAHLVNTVKELSDRKIGLRVLTGKGAQIDTTTASGRMVFGIFATLAEFERDLIRERTMAGLASARARGRKGGRKFALTKAQVRLVQAAMAQRDTSVSDLCKELGIERVTLYRYVGPKGELRDHGKHVLGLT